MNTLNDSNDTGLRKLVLTGLPEEYLINKDFELFIHSLRCLARSILFYYLASHLLVLITIRPIKAEEK
jgi:hypothetical protein